MSSFQIIKDAPIPLKRSVDWPFPDMEVMDAFDVPIWKQSVAMHAARIFGLINGRRFISRKIADQTVRIWRVS